MTIKRSVKYNRPKGGSLQPGMYDTGVVAPIIGAILTSLTLLSILLAIVLHA